LNDISDTSCWKITMYPGKRLLFLALGPFLALAVQLEIAISPSHSLPTPPRFQYSTRADLTLNGSPIIAPITRANTFIFNIVPAGSHLLSVYSRDAIFEDLRVDVSANDTGEYVSAWTTWRGNEWDNRGESRGGGYGHNVRLEVRPVAGKEYYQQRASFSILSLLKNPMILIALFSLVMVVGMPYLMDNLDPEIKAELEEMQRKNKGMSNSASNIQNMDIGNSIASWMAGSSTSGDKNAKK